MAIDYDTRVSVSPQPPQDGRWAIFVPASYKNMTLGEAQLPTESEYYAAADVVKEAARLRAAVPAAAAAAAVANV